MRRVSACKLRCTSRPLNRSIQIRCAQRLSLAHRPKASLVRFSIPAAVSLPRCRYSEQPANRPQKEENPAKPPPPPPQQSLADDPEEVRRKAQRDAILSRLTRKDTSKNAPPITWWSVAILALLAAAVSFLLNEEKKQRQQSRKSVGTAKIGGNWTLVDTDGVPRTDHEFRFGVLKDLFLFSHLGVSFSLYISASPSVLTFALWNSKRLATLLMSSVRSSGAINLLSKS